MDYVCSKPAGVFSGRQKQNGRNGSRAAEAEQPFPLEKEEKGPPDLLTGYAPEDVGNGQRLIAMYGDRLRYCHEFKSWLVWDGSRWCIDHGDAARKLTQETMQEFALQAVKANNEPATKFAAGSRRSSRISNAMREAQPHLAISQQKLDRDPYLLNFLNGTMDLRTGELQPHKRGHFITKLVHHNYNPSAECPTFHAMLRRIMGHMPGATQEQLDRANRLIRYLQTAFGYSLTGVTSEKVVLLLYGKGDNGKSTLLSTFFKIIEEYAVVLQIDTLMVSHESNNKQADLADLRGARFAITSETEKEQRLAEGKLKRITQGMGRIKATLKYENPIEFEETHKLWIDANHLPIVRGSDDAIWNRLHPIPFSVVIPKGEQDKRLPMKLETDAEGILAWAVQGAILWHNEGLGKPPEVHRAGIDWRTKSNQIGRFLEARCVKNASAQVRARALYEAYCHWCGLVDESRESKKTFRQNLQNMGFLTTRDEDGMTYHGIRLNADRW